ncbi:MAG: glycoside hydrolase family 55 protein [Verrucomicrobiales bacterium]|nr:glycoside hydrolase family 55 protein [Verrucomicrobiales bacterium]
MEKHRSLIPSVGTRSLLLLFVALLIAHLPLTQTTAAPRHAFTEHEIAKIIKKNQIDRAAFDLIKDYIYPTIHSPVADLVDLTQAPIPGQRQMKWGILNVTEAPFAADPTGKIDSTKAIQQAVNFARDHQLVCFFPAGDYLISDTIVCANYLYLRSNFKLQGTTMYPCVLRGTARFPNKRAKLILAANAPGFDDPDNRKLLISYKALPNLKPRFKKGYANDEQANILYNQLFTDIDIEIRPGNPGAVAIRMQGAEGSSIQNTTINLGDGLLGIQGLAGSGGSHHNIHIIGGKVGIDSRGLGVEFSLKSTGTQPGPTLTHITLENQKETALINRSRGPLVCVGLKILSSTNGPLIKNLKSNGINGSLALIDSELIFSKPGNHLAIEAERSFYLRNTFVKNAKEIYPSYLSGAGWQHIKELAVPLAIKSRVGSQMSEHVYIDGKISTQRYFKITPSSAPPANLRSKHIWGKHFPSWEKKGIANVKEEPYLASGDGIVDDTQAIQKAIDTNPIVFLPKGVYNISSPLRLKPNTKLIGLSNVLSSIISRDPVGIFDAPNNPRALIETADTADAETVIAFLGVFINFQSRRLGASKESGHMGIHWRSGGNSMIRSIWLMPKRLYGFETYRNLTNQKFNAPSMKVSGNGGGKIYNLYIHNVSPALRSYRHLIIEDTQQPLSFYHLHAQHTPSEFQLEFKNAKNVSVYGIKCEYDTEQDSAALRAVNCDNLKLYGHAGVAQPAEGGTHYVFQNCTNFLMAVTSDQPTFQPTNKESIHGGLRVMLKRYVDEYHFLKETSADSEFTMPPLHRATLYIRGEPRFE